MALSPLARAAARTLVDTHRMGPGRDTFDVFFYFCLLAASAQAAVCAASLALAVVSQRGFCAARHHGDTARAQPHRNLRRHARSDRDCVASRTTTLVGHR